MAQVPLHRAKDDWLQYAIGCLSHRTKCCGKFFGKLRHSKIPFHMGEFISPHISSERDAYSQNPEALYFGITPELSANLGKY